MIVAGTPEKIGEAVNLVRTGGAMKLMLSKAGSFVAYFLLIGYLVVMIVAVASIGITMLGVPVNAWTRPLVLQRWSQMDWSVLFVIVGVIATIVWWSSFRIASKVSTDRRHENGPSTEAKVGALADLERSLEIAGAEQLRREQLAEDAYARVLQKQRDARVSSKEYWSEYSGKIVAALESVGEVLGRELINAQPQADEHLEPLLRRAALKMVRRRLYQWAKEMSCSAVAALRKTASKEQCVSSP